MTTNPTQTPEAIEAAALEMFAIYEPIGNWEEASQGAKDGYMYRAIRVLTAAAPFIAAQAKAEALREEAIELETKAIAFDAVSDNPDSYELDVIIRYGAYASQARSTAHRLRARAATIEGKNS